MAKVYVKRGFRQVAERKMEKELSAFVDAKLKEDPSFELTPARNVDELKRYYNAYCTEETAIISETKNTGMATKKESPIEEAVHIDEKQESTSHVEAEPSDEIEDVVPEAETKYTIDPMLRSNPVIRDYVTEESGNSIPDGDKVQHEHTGSGSIEEPKNFKDAFGIPNDPNNPDQKQEKTKPKKEEPFNPAFDEMSTSKKNKSTKRMAKYIVEAVCMLTSRGLIWWSNKDINDIKLAEYELEFTEKGSGIDLSLLLAMPDDQQITVKQFFQNQCTQSTELFKYTDGEKEDLTDALYEFMLEKGFAPTPTQNLIMISLSVIGSKALMAFQMKTQLSAFIEQLKAKNPLKEEEVESEEPKRHENTQVNSEEQEKPKRGRKKKIK